MPACLIGLGSNLGNRRENILSALARLGEHPQVELRARSSLHETAAVGGPTGQAPFLNAAAKLETALPPRDLLELLWETETRLGRRRRRRWGPRTIDLDLLLYDELTMDSAELTLPHPRMSWRRFVLEPATEAAGEMVHPTIGWSVARLLEHINTTPAYLAVTGGIAAGKTSLTRRLAAKLPARPIFERPDWKRLESFYADPAGNAWKTELAFLEHRAALLGGLSAFSPPTVSDFWFDQSAAFARAWLPAERIEDYTRRFDRLRAAAPRPRLIVLLDVSATEMLTRVRRRGRDCERRLTVEQLERIRCSAAEQAGRPDLGPVLRCAAENEEAVFADALAAARASQ